MKKFLESLSTAIELLAMLIFSICFIAAIVAIAFGIPGYIIIKIIEAIKA
jgi:hypothetical protein